jgi:hypothetical protein
MFPRFNRGHDHMVIGSTITYAICVYHHFSCVSEPLSWRGVLDTTLCDKICQWLAAGQWFSPGTPVSYTNKTEILLKVLLNTITKPRFNWSKLMLCKVDSLTNHLT